MTPERLATFTNADEQTEAQVHRDHRGGATVRLVDLDSGEDKARIDVPSPSQGFLFPAPGWDRDIYYQSMTTIARVSVK